MIITNHNKNGFYNLIDGTCIRGTITINQKENYIITAFLLRQYQEAIRENRIYERLALGQKPTFSKNKKYFSLGVCATKLALSLFVDKKFNYKNQNYAFTIKN